MSILLLISLLFATSFAEDDVLYLREVRNSLGDPLGKLGSWNFCDGEGTAMAVGSGQLGL